MRLFFIALFVASFLVSCGGDKALEVVPVGEKPPLERLAKAYEAMSEQVAGNPRSLEPKERLRFVRFVFEKAGYDYDATLEALSRIEPDPMNPHQRDLAELLLLPHRASGWVDPAEVYSAEELPWVTRIEAAFF